MLRRMWAQCFRRIGPAISPVLLAAKRLKAEAWLAVAISVGLLAAVAFTTSIPTYSNAVYVRLLRKELHEKTKNYPPFAFMFHFLGAKHGYAEWDDVLSVDTFLTKQAAGDLGLPRIVDVQFFQTVPYSIFPQDSETNAIAHSPTADLSFAFQSNLEQKVTMLEGRFAAGSGLFSSRSAPVEVIININLAQKMGWQVGETFVAFSDESADSEDKSIQIPFRVVGIWQMTNRNDEYWFYNPFALIRDQLLVSEEAFARQIGSAMKGEIAVGAWYMVLDGEQFEVREASAFLERLRRVDQRAASLLSGTSLIVAPSSSGLERYQRAAQAMTQSLFVIALPIFGAIVAYLWLVAGVYVERRRAEISLLRSRGASASQLAIMVALEALVLGGIGWAGGVPVGSRVAQVIDRTQAFLEFGGSSGSQMTITPSVERIAIVTVGLALLFILVPTLDATRHTLASYRQERARGRWRWRHGLALDLLILLAAGYGLFRLSSQGGLVSPGADDADGVGPMLDPLLFITPVLWLLGFALFGVRALTPLMLAISWLSRHLEGLGLLLAVRRLARSTGSYRIPLLLLILTLSLAVFTASLAQTMGKQIAAEIRYRFGADMRLTEVGESIEIDPLGLDSSSGNKGSEAGNFSQESTSAEGYTSWSFLPLAEHRDAPGVQAVARVGRYRALAEVGQWKLEGHFIGIDRVDFPEVVFWRSDFAHSSLGSLMNSLALAPNGVLVPNSFLQRMVLKEGDDLRVVVSIPEQRKELTWLEAPIEFLIVGSFDRFPSWEPEHGPAIVGNLDYVFESAGGQFPFDVWLRTEPDPDYSLIEKELRDKGFRILGWDAPGPWVLQALRRPEFQGVVGLLSIGFIACTLLTILGFVLFTVSSFRERAIETGVLRALGFTPQEVISLMGWELIVLLLFGLTVGTGIGIWTCGAFIPFLQSGIDPMPTLLPLAPQIAWPRVYQVYLILGILYFCSTALLTVSLMRSQVTHAIKMGETI